MEAYRDQYAELFRGGRDIILIAIATDQPEAQESWARDAEFPFLFASDPEASVGQAYGAFTRRRNGSFIDNRTVFIIDGEGKIEWVAAPFREIDPEAYVALNEALEQFAPRSEDDVM
jgi:thioredoxin-dependent peroxiredoxin